MAFADPQSVTIATVAISLPRTSTGVGSSVYTSADGLTVLTPSSSYGKRTRRSLRLTSSKIAADPFTSGINQSYSMSAYLVLDTPILGYTPTEQLDVAEGLLTYLSASSYAAVVKLIGGEN
jgi:hypothetical protein